MTELDDKYPHEFTTAEDYFEWFEGPDGPGPGILSDGWREAVVCYELVLHDGSLTPALADWRWAQTQLSRCGVDREQHYELHAVFGWPHGRPRY